MRSSWLHHNADRALALIFGLATALVVGLVALILFYLARESLPFVDHLQWKELFINADWYPASLQFGMAGMLLASLCITLGAVLLATPLGIGCAVFMEFFAPRALLTAMKLILGLITGTPSVVFGLWGTTVLIPWIASRWPPGSSLLASVLILGLMILPTVALTSFSAVQTLPASLRQASIALGVGIKGHVLSVALPAARRGVVAGIILALARAAGETMAVLMVSGNVAAMPSSIFDPVRALTANIALEMAYATGVHRAALFMTGLLLAIVVLLLVLVSEAYRGQSSHE
jgi:phosphate transport system permease protein